MVQKSYAYKFAKLDSIQNEKKKRLSPHFGQERSKAFKMHLDLV